MLYSSKAHDVFRASEVLGSTNSWLALKWYGNMFLLGLLLRTIEITLKSAAKCLVAAQFLKYQGTKIWQRDQPSVILDIRKIHDFTTSVNFVFFKEHVGKMCKVKNSWICMYLRFTKVEMFLENFMSIQITNRKFHAFLHDCDVIKTDLIIKEDGEQLVSLSFNISETKHDAKNPTTDFRVILMVLSNNQRTSQKIYCHKPLTHYE